MTTTDEDVWSTVETVLERRVPLAVACTGGGSQLATWLLNHPGASRAVVDVQIPYHQKALDDYIGATGPFRVDAETARLMSLRAYRRCVEFAGGGPAIGLGCTAALATNRDRRGEDRAFIVVRADAEYDCCQLLFPKGKASREEQEEVLSKAALRQLVRALMCSDDAGLDVHPVAEGHCSRLPVVDGIESLLEGGVATVLLERDGGIGLPEQPNPGVVFPGSFNPLHRGHEELATAVRRRLDQEVYLELSVSNVDKPLLPYASVLERLDGLKGRFPVLVTRAATFREKGRLFPGTCFVMGYDTAERLLDPRYYPKGKAGVVATLQFFADEGIHFLVAGRSHDGVFRTMADLPVPTEHADLFTGMDEREFRNDLSSSDLRAASTA